MLLINLFRHKDIEVIITRCKGTHFFLFNGKRAGKVAKKGSPKAP